MPHIFPRRFLRTRDVLDPTDFNEDFHPVYDILQGRLDRTNFNADDLKTKLRSHPDSTSPKSTGPCVAEGAYFNTHVSQIESRFEFWTEVSTKRPAPRKPPNFVRLDGATFRDYFNFDGTSPNAYPSIVPNHGAWSAVKNADLSGSQKLTFTTGHSKIWISAYAQYIWQGFFEEKKPWIPGFRFRGADLAAPEFGESWFGAHGIKDIAMKERDVLNHLGPSPLHEALPSPFTLNETGKVRIYDEEFSYPLNEKTKTKGNFSEEQDHPNRLGYHHISQGFDPCLVQFAIRLDGKIIEETITGKRLPFEESAHGLKVSDGIRTKDEDELEKEKWEATLSGSIEPDTLTFAGQTTGQRSWGVTSTLGESKDSRPGQKLKSSRAVAYGPEVMPTRLGAVVEVQPGEHTIELCVRRLQRKKGKFQKGDFVGVFSRRLLAFDLPIHPSRTPTKTEGDASSPFYVEPAGNIPSFKTETPLTFDNVTQVRKNLGDSLNDIKDQSLDDEIFSNQYLPSKVVFAKTDIISPTIQVDAATGEFFTSEGCRSEAIYPGYKNGTSLANNVLTSSSSGWRTEDGSSLLSPTRMGWLQLNSGSSSNLSISLSPSEQVLRPHEQIILMMDVELLQIDPLYSDGALDAINAMIKFDGGPKIRKLNRDFTRYCLAERYLDLFAFFAIGYKEDDSWKISTDGVPAVVNSFSWLNRSPLFDSSVGMANLPMKRHATINWWDQSPGWDGIIRSEANAFFSDDTEETMYINTSTYTGGHLFDSPMGINIPIMTVIENTGSTDRTISEFGGFTCTMCPSVWTSGYGPNSQRSAKTEGTDVIFFEAEYELPYERQWASPVGGRDILKGVRVTYGNARLTAFKVHK